jgi:hypothetical protein
MGFRGWAASIVEEFSNVLANIAVSTFALKMETAVFAETLDNSTFDPAYPRKPKLYIELQPRKPKNNN